MRGFDFIITGSEYKKFTLATVWEIWLEKGDRNRSRWGQSIQETEKSDGSWGAVWQ